MTPSVISRLSHVWPFSLFKLDDLKISNSLVSRLSVSEQVKEFLYAIPQSEKGSVLYILAVQNLSEQSVRDAELLIMEIKPEAVVVQVAPSSLHEFLSELDCLNNLVPTSSYGVIRKCFSDKLNRAQYEKLVGGLVLREIFGTSFHGHLLASKRAAEEVHARFLLLEYPTDSALCMPFSLVDETEYYSSRSFLASEVVFTKLCLSDPVQSQMLKLVCQSISLSMSKSVLSENSEDSRVKTDFQAPSFAQAVYQLLVDLHDIFFGLPAMKVALVYAQKILTDIDEGVPIDARLLKEVQNFRVAIEGLRIALNSAARCPLDQLKKETAVEFDLLSSEEKCHALFAQALRNQAKQYNSVVAIVDAGSLSSLRKHWNTIVPAKVSLLAEQGFIHLNNECAFNNEMAIEGTERKRLLAHTPMVAVGAGATAAIGVSSLSKALPASTLVKLVSYQIPTILKFGVAHVHRSTAIALSKLVASSKILAPGVASKASGLKVSASAEKIRRVTHGLIASVERTSLFAMRTAFYEIMRKRNVRPVRFAPWATFAGSTVTCAGLLMYGDGIECAAELIPSAPVIASWGRGLESLRQASQQVGEANGGRIQETLQSLIYNLRKMKVQ